jgi:hypothetical protein
MGFPKVYRWLVAVAMAVALSLLAALVWVVVWRQPGGRFDWERYNRIRLGMTRTEVEAAMGCPPGSYPPPCDHPEQFELRVVDAQNVPHCPWSGVSLGPDEPVWWDDLLSVIAVYFTADGRVYGKSLTVPWQPSLRDRLRKPLAF